MKSGCGFSLVNKVGCIGSPNNVSNFLNHENCNIDELNLTRSQLHDVYNKYLKLKKNFNKLIGDYQNLSDAASELTIALENSINGHPIDFDTIVQYCNKISLNQGKIKTPVLSDSEVNNNLMK